jgi:4-amino-4-deoxy-L-arabinose transferase-like glycosyltransferase
LDSSIRACLYLFGLTTALFFFGLGSRDFWAPVEPRYAEIARVMFLKSEWILPTINGELYTDKPILYFWLVLIAAKLFGAVNEWTVRLPAAFGGIGLIFGTYLIGRDFLNARSGLFGAVILATSMRVIWEARWAHVDTIFCACFVFAIYFGARALLRDEKSTPFLFAYVFIALATLTKGLIGIVLPGLIFAGFVLIRRDWRMFMKTKLHWGIPIFLLIAAPWFYWVSQATGGKWLADFIYIHHIQRYTAGAGHRQPFYYYLTTLPVDFLPWTIFIVPAFFGYRPLRSRLSDPVVQFFLVWFLAVFLFFSLSDTKRDLYLMPLLPVPALLVGRYFADLCDEKPPQDGLFGWLISIFFEVTALSGVALALLTWQYRPDAFAAGLPGSAVIVITAVAVVFYVRRRRPFNVLVSVVTLMALIVICASIWMMPYLENFKSPRRFSFAVTKIVPASMPIYIYADTMNDFNYYMQREIIPVLAGPAAVDAVLRRAGYLLVKERDLKRLPQLSPQWIIASDRNTSSMWRLIEIGKRQTP